MKKARLQVSVLPMLLLKAHVNNFMVEGLTLDLRKKEDGSTTWQIDLPEGKKEKVETKPVPTDSKDSSFVLSEDSFVLESLDIKDITVTYHDPSMDAPTVFTMETWTGQALAGKPFEMVMKGTVMEHPFTASVKGASLKNFLETSKSE